MAVKTIISVPEHADVLKSVSEKVSMDDPLLPEIIRDMKDTLMATPSGVGLAAVQIGVRKRIFALRKHYVYDYLDENSAFRQKEDEVFIFINPKIISAKGTLNEEEGCLSVPGQSRRIKRARLVKLRALDENGVQFYDTFRGLASRAVQQEMDHLNGILIIDHKE